MTTGLIFSVDPGDKLSAFVLYDPELSAVLVKGIERNEVLLENVRVLPFDTSVFAIERLKSFGMSVGQEVFQTIEFFGRLVEAASRQPVQLWAVGRKQICSHHLSRTPKALTESVKTADAKMRAAMQYRLGAKTTGVFKDMWSALCVATCVADKIAAGEQPPAL